MLELFNAESSYVLPSGRSIAGAELAETHKILGMTDCVVDVVGGVLQTIEPLESMAANYGVEVGEDKQAALDEIVAAIKENAEFNKTPKSVLEQAAADAKEAKTTADTASASVNEYMDALLGLNTTDETEATDAE